MHPSGGPAVLQMRWPPKLARKSKYWKQPYQLGENNPHCIPLKEALRVARAKSKVGQADRCVQGVHRESQEASQSHRGRHCQSPRRRCSIETEVQEGEARLKELEAEAAVSVPEPVTPVISDLQRQIDTGSRFVEGGGPTEEARSVDGRWTAGSRGDSTHAHHTDVQEVEGWLSSRIANCATFSSSGFEVQLVWQDSPQMCPWGGPGQPSLMSASIDKGDAKRL